MGSVGGGSDDEAGAPDANEAGWPVGDPGTKGDGDFTIMPPYTAHPLIKVIASNPHGKIYRFTLPSQGTLFDGLDKTLATANQHTFTRDVRLYVPKQYVDGTSAPFMVVQDGDGYVTDVQNSLDNLIAAKKVPIMLAVLVNNGGGDGQDSERGLEYDTMSDRYSRFIDTDVLPAVLRDATIKADYPNLKFTDNPEGRSSYGCSSGGAAALTQGWFTPDKYRRIVTYSGTFVAQQDNQGIKAPEAAQYPLGAWEYHSDMELIANSPVKPLRVFLNASEHDNQLDAMFHDTYHEWLVANQRTASALKAKGYHYRFIYALGVGHCDGSVRQATLPDTFEWMWQGYPIN
jgi:enterochelin esterase-like enzyme